MSQRVVLGLGANLGSPRQTLAGAVQELRLLGPSRFLVSSLYKTAPIGPEQPDFLNAAVCLCWSGSLFSLLSKTQELELKWGRERGLRWGPRTLDVDVLWAEEESCSQKELCVPHPELVRRAFALLPLVEVCPDARDPHSLRLYSSFLQDVREQRVERSAGPGWSSEPLFALARGE